MRQLITGSVLPLSKCPYMQILTTRWRWGVHQGKNGTKNLSGLTIFHDGSTKCEFCRRQEELLLVVSLCCYMFYQGTSAVMFFCPSWLVTRPIRHVIHPLPTQKSKITIVLVATGSILCGFRDLGRLTGFVYMLIDHSLYCYSKFCEKKRTKKKIVIQTSVYWEVWNVYIYYDDGNA